MFDELKCRLGFHKLAHKHWSEKIRSRTTNKGRSKKRWHTLAKVLYTQTYCERCGKVFKTKRKVKWRF